MEKLRKALDRARDERAGITTAEVMAMPPPVALPPPRVTSSEPVRPTPGVDTGEYVYTQTKVYTPDAATLERHRILVPGSTSTAADAFRMLRTQVAQRMGEHGWRTLAVCSAQRGEGRTLAATNLAVTLSADPRYSVLLCDLDLRAPSVATLFGLEVEAGVDDVLAGRATVEDCFVHPRGFDRLVLLPARATLGGSSEYLASAATARLVSELRARYPDRILIFDLPPVLLSDDALAFSPNVECALVVVAEGSTRRADLTRCLEMLKNTPVVGTVLNRSLSGKASAA